MKYVSAKTALEYLCGEKEDLLSGVRTAVVVAHPDDEVCGLGSRLHRLRNALFIYVTDGSPRNLDDAHREGFATREAYALARRRELYSALTLAGIPVEQTRRLGFVDQEAAQNLVDLSMHLSNLLRDVQLVITHAYEGGHPDHDSTAFAVHAGARLLRNRPCILEMASYHIRNGAIETSDFIQPNSGADHEITTISLSSQEQYFKRRLFECFPTQKETLTWFCFDAERFRPAPNYDFTRPQHAGQLFYEKFNWGMTGEQWRALAGRALQRLDKGLDFRRFREDFFLQ